MRRRLFTLCAVISAATIVAAAVGCGSSSTASSGGAPKTVTVTKAAATAATPPATTTSAAPSPPPAKAHITFGERILTVPGDVQRGTYRTREGSSGCYWAVLRDFKNGLNSIITNENTDAPAIATIGASAHGFTSSGCAEWTDDLSRISASRTTIEPGTYFVGTDIAPGTYRSAGGEGCYYARLRDFTGGLNSILANDNPTGSVIVQIEPGDRGFTSTNCAPFTRS